MAGYWSFDDGTATDNSGNGNNGSLINAPAVVAGKNGQALNFNGSNQYVSLGNVLNPGTGDLSIFAWVRTTQSGNFNMILSKRDASLVTNGGYQLFQNGNNAVSFAFGDGNSSRVKIDSTGPRINDGVWHLVGAVFTRSGNGVLYVDGAPAAAGTGSIANQSGAVSNALALRIGAEQQGFNWAGAIDEVRIYNRALTAGDAQHQVRGGNVAAAIPKLVDDHIGDGGAPAHLACPSGQQDGVDVEQPHVLLQGRKRAGAGVEPEEGRCARRRHS